MNNGTQGANMGQLETEINKINDLNVAKAQLAASVADEIRIEAALAAATPGSEELIALERQYDIASQIVDYYSDKVSQLS